jgi:signal transduction histidine kinase
VVCGTGSFSFLEEYGRLVKVCDVDGEISSSNNSTRTPFPKINNSTSLIAFFHVEGETQVIFPGLGLGLYISTEIVRRHHGSIWVKSEEGKGTTISFSLLVEKIKEESRS